MMAVVGPLLLGIFTPCFSRSCLGAKKVSEPESREIRLSPIVDPGSILVMAVTGLPTVMYLVKDMMFGMGNGCSLHGPAATNILDFKHKHPCTKLISN